MVSWIAETLRWERGEVMSEMIEIWVMRLL